MGDDDMTMTMMTNFSTLQPEKLDELAETVIHDDDSDFNECGSAFSYNVSTIVLFVFGTIGNTIVIAILRRPVLRRRPGSPGLTCLVMFNTISLLVNAASAIDEMTAEEYGSIEEYIGPIGCKVVRFLPACIQLMGHWVVVYITAQRFVTICLQRQGGPVFKDANAKPIFSCLFMLLCATQLWRPYLDTQEAAVYRNTSNGTLVLEAPAMCTAEHLGIHIDIESFFYRLILLFLFPAILILFMNTAVISRLYQDYNRNRTIRQLVRQHANNNAVVTQSHTVYLGELETLNTAAPMETKLKKATIVLLAVTCTFWLYIMPQLLLLLYVRFSEMFYGRLEGHSAFIKVCKALNVTSIVATISSADHLIIQLTFDEMFRLQLKFLVYRFFGKCSVHCLYLYIRERQLQRNRSIISVASSSSNHDLHNGTSRANHRHNNQNGGAALNNNHRHNAINRRQPPVVRNEHHRTSTTALPPAFAFIGFSTNGGQLLSRKPGDLALKPEVETTEESPADDAKPAPPPPDENEEKQPAKD